MFVIPDQHFRECVLRSVLQKHIQNGGGALDFEKNIFMLI